MPDALFSTRPAVTRLAPSPTGALHLGNARTFLINWALARRENWRILLRIEDLDGPRVSRERSAATIETLAWLGIDWDVGPVYQSHDPAPYLSAMGGLARAGMVYPSDLSRGEVEEAVSAPQEGSHEVKFPASLRPASFPREFVDDGRNWRFTTPSGVVRFHDLFKGDQAIDSSETIGDFIVWTRRHQAAYQLAVVVDDHRQGVTHVVRGDDLLESAARQIHLYRALNSSDIPSHLHLPLVRAADGRRLAKRHGDTRIDTYRRLGVPRERIIALLARWCGIDAGNALSPAEFAHTLTLDTIPRTDVVFTKEDDAWLLGDTPRT